MVAGGNGEVVLTWEAPEDDGGSAITDYEYRIDGKGDWISTDSTDTTHTVTGLDNGTEYTFEVRAVNRNRKGRASDRARPRRKCLPWTSRISPMGPVSPPRWCS